MIVTLTLNPAIDKSTEIDRLIPEKKMRCPEMLVEAGGGGINVSKAIHELDGTSTAIFPCGGINGKLLVQLLNEKGISARPIEVQANTRENFVATELSTNKQYRFVMPGSSLSDNEINTIKDTLRNLQGISWLIFSGSLPPNVPPTFLGGIADIARQKGIKLIADTSGEPLKAAVEKGVYLLKPNLSELCSLVGKEYLELSEIDDAAEEVISNGLCEVLVVSMGPSGAMLVTKDEARHFKAPVVKKISTVGAGDSMVAGMVWMMEQGKTLIEAVQFGIACGTAATINKGTHLFNKEDALKLFEWMKKYS